MLVRLAIQVVFTAVLARCVYLRYFHPLSRYPGPVIASFTNLWYAMQPPFPENAVCELIQSVGSYLRTSMVNITLLSKNFMKSMVMWSVPVPTVFLSRA